MIRIFLETGKKATSEFVFIETLLKELNIGGSATIETVNGKDNLHNAKNAFIDNTLNGGINLIIFDADDSSNSGGFEKRRKELLSKIQEMGISARLFLFPDNQTDGCFEDLLLKIARKDKYQRFFDCFQDYEMCLGDDFVHPNLKGKIFTYISSMKSMTSRQRAGLGDGKWLFENPEYWDLQSEALQPLNKFILDAITQ